MRRKNRLRPGNLDRKAGQREQCIHEVGVAFSPHPGMHSTHRSAHHEAQMLESQPFRDETIFERHHILVVIVGNLRCRPSLGLVDCPWPSHPAK